MSTYISEQSEWKEEWKNFVLDEFKCKCGCEKVKINSIGLHGKIFANYHYLLLLNIKCIDD